MSEHRHSITGLAMALAMMLALMAGSAAAQGTGQKEAPVPPPPPKSIEAEVLVILASKAATPEVDPGLQAVAAMLQKKFAGQYNRFRLQRSSRDDIKQSQVSSFPLVTGMTLRLGYNSVKSKGGQELVELSLSVMKVESVTDGSGNTRKVEKAVIAPMTVGVVRNQYFLVGGPQVDSDTLIIAVRVTG